MCIYTRQNKLRVRPRSKQCISIFSRMPALIQLPKRLNILTGDLLRSHEQFPVKIIFSKIVIFEISKILIFNPKSFNSFLMINLPFFNQTFEKSISKQIFMNLVTYSDSRRFFQNKISPLFSTVFQTVDGRRIRNAIVISNLRLYQTITDISFVISLMIQYFI